MSVSVLVAKIGHLLHLWPESAVIRRARKTSSRTCILATAELGGKVVAEVWIGSGHARGTI